MVWRSVPAGFVDRLDRRWKAAVVTVEMDPHLFQLAREHLMKFPQVRMLQLDALKNKRTCIRRSWRRCEAELSEPPGRRLKVVANLPFNIATPVVSNLLSTDLGRSR